MTYLALDPSVSRILGLLEAVHDAGGEDDVARIAMDFDEELDEIQRTLESVEYLGFGVVDQGNLRLTEAARELLRSGIQKRKKLFRQRLLSLPIFQVVQATLQTAPEGHASREEVRAALGDKVGPGDWDELFKCLVNWGRYAELLAYDPGQDEFRLK